MLRDLTHEISTASPYKTFLCEALRTLQTSPTSLQRAPYAYELLFETKNSLALPSVFLVQPRMLGVPDLPRSSRLPNLVHLSSFTPVQRYSIGTEARAFPCFSLDLLVHLYFFLFHCLYCISFKGDRLILPHA